jgi:hypothetical protein
MKIDELTDKQKGVNLTLKVIYDQMPEKEFKGRRSKTIVVVDADAEQGGTTALLDLFDDDIDLYTHKTKFKVVNGYAKEITTKRGKQFLITYGFFNGTLVGHYEKIEND